MRELMKELMDRMLEDMIIYGQVVPILGEVIIDKLETILFLSKLTHENWKFSLIVDYYWGLQLNLGLQLISKYTPQFIKLLLIH